VILEANAREVMINVRLASISGAVRDKHLGLAF
ncbi:MAG: hypothetical protein QOE55_5689, partial [Acidobacteriaceae bacterium]|nr:hypothetical protein [Acidobacteriaceae bacterium]